MVNGTRKGARESGHLTTGWFGTVDLRWKWPLLVLLNLGARGSTYLRLQPGDFVNAQEFVAVRVNHLKVHPLGHPGVIFLPCSCKYSRNECVVHSPFRGHSRSFPLPELELMRVLQGGGLTFHCFRKNYASTIANTVCAHTIGHTNNNTKSTTKSCQH